MGKRSGGNQLFCCFPTLVVFVGSILELPFLTLPISYHRTDKVNRSLIIFPK